MAEVLPSGEDLAKEVQKRKDGDQLFKPNEDFKALLLGDDEDSLALVFQHVTPDDDGVKTCVARTSRGLLSFGAVVQGAVTQLEEDETDIKHSTQKAGFQHWKPSFIIEKREVTINDGDQAMLEVQVKGYPKPEIRCTKEDIPIRPSTKYKAFHEEEEGIYLLVIKDVEFKDAGVYVITAENEIGFDSAEIKLNVIRQKYPQIKTKLEDISIHVDQILIIPVQVEGIPKPEVKFMKDGRVIKESENCKLFEKDQSYSLTIVKTTLKDTGVYSVVATSELAQVSQFWSLYVFSKPRFVENLGGNRIVSQASEIVFKVKLESEPKADVKWLKGDKEIIPEKRIIIDKNQGYFILKIKNVVTNDSGSYTFKAMNIHGSIEDSVRVDVKKAPTVTETFRDMTVIEQDVFHFIHSITFAVKLEAFPKPKVKWYLDDVIIDETREAFTFIDTNDELKLVINEATTDISGYYTCQIVNECGYAEESAKLTVNCSPRILEHLNDVTITEGNVLKLEVKVRGFPSPRFKWLRNGKEVDTDDRIQMGLETMGKNRYNIIYMVNSIKYEERGTYEIVVINEIGTAKMACFVTVHTSPIILETNMVDHRIDEYSDITYMVRGFSDPAPVATWTWEGHEIKCDVENNWHDKIISSQNGEEFRLGMRRLRPVDTGLYNCTLSNYVGEVSRKVDLKVLRRKL